MTDDTAPNPLLDELIAQEAELVFDSFEQADAWELGTAIRERAVREGLPVSISIFLGERRVFHASLPGAAATNDEWIERKARVVRKFDASSFRVGTEWQSLGRDFDTQSKLDPTLFAAHGGAFPLHVGDIQIGVVGVSGLPQKSDHDLVVAVLREFLASR
jgi:uncharacterized protein (UPF0303 family)